MRRKQLILLSGAVAVTLATLASFAEAGPITSDQHPNLDRIGPTAVGNPLPQGERPLPGLIGLPGSGTTGPQTMTVIQEARPAAASRSDLGRDVTQPQPRQAGGEIRPAVMAPPAAPIDRP